MLFTSTAWRRKSGIIWKKSSDYEVMTRFFICLFGRNFNLTSGKTFSGVEWYTRLTPVGAFERKYYNIAQCLHLLAGLIWVYFLWQPKNIFHESFLRQFIRNHTEIFKLKETVMFGKRFSKWQAGPRSALITSTHFGILSSWPTERFVNVSLRGFDIYKQNKFTQGKFYYGKRFIL